MLYSFLRFVVSPIAHIVLNLKYEGVENISSEGGFVLCSNHRTFLDPILIAIGIKKRKLRFMAKKELFENKFAAAFFKALGAFPVNRGTGDIGAIKKAEEIVGEDHVLLIFPEGTRSKTGQPARPKSGAAYIASESGCDVVPTAICYDTNKIGFRTKITVCFGKPIPNEDIAIREETRIADVRRASAIIMEEIVSLMNKHLKTPVKCPVSSKGRDKNE